MTQYRQDWFSDRKRLLENALHSYKGKPDLVFMEIGSYEGRSANWFLTEILTGENTGMFCIDNFSGSRKEKDEGYDVSGVKQRFLDNMKQHEDRYYLLEGDSQDVLRRGDYDGLIDVIYIDGSHRADDLALDLVNCYYTLKKGGLFLIDDYLWNFQRYPAHETPKLAIDSFIQIFKDRVEPMFVSNKLVVLKKLW